MKYNNIVQYAFIVSLIQFATLVEAASKCEFAIVIASYNNEKYFKENLDSVCWQKSTNPYHIYYINDASTDATGKCVEEYVKQNRLKGKLTLINNESNKGGCANLYNTIHDFIDDNKIVVIVDGDDLLPHNDVLLTLEEKYKNPDVWMTHSKLKYIPTEYVEGEEVADWIYDQKVIREKSEWITALRTFRAGLYKKIKKQDLFYEGAWMKVSWDVAFCIPMLEMCASECSCGKSQCIFIDDILYLYRINTPYNDYKTKKALQLEVEAYIRSLQKYEPLGKPL